MTYYRDVSPKAVIGFSIRSPKAWGEVGDRMCPVATGLPCQMPVGERSRDSQGSREIQRGLFGILTCSRSGLTFARAVASLIRFSNRLSVCTLCVRCPRSRLQGHPAFRRRKCNCTQGGCGLNYMAAPRFEAPAKGRESKIASPNWWDAS